MKHTTNGYALTMTTTLNPISIADVLVNSFEYWVKIADKALFKEFNRYGEARELVSDVWTSFSNKEKAANTVAFAGTVEEAEKILGRQVRLYAKNARYIPGLADLAKARTANKGMDITMCSMGAVEETLTAADELSMSIDVVFAKDYATKWDQMCDDGELTIEQKLDMIRQLAVPFASCTTADERMTLVGVIRDMLDLGPDSPVELQEAMYTLLAQ